MYIPKHFQDNDKLSLFNTIHEIKTANLITQHHNNELIATFLPLYLEEKEDKYGTLYGHIAKANSQWNTPLSTTKILAIFTGDNAYITPSWYPTKKIHPKAVPTWNYISIHVHGTISFIEEANPLLSIITKLTNIHEKTFQHPWQVNDAPSSYIQTMLKAIIGIKITIEHIEGKRKLSQNQPIENQQGIINGLSQQNKPDHTKLAKLMKSNLDQKE